MSYGPLKTTHLSNLELDCIRALHKQHKLRRFQWGYWDPNINTIDEAFEDFPSDPGYKDHETEVLCIRFQSLDEPEFREGYYHPDDYKDFTEWLRSKK